MRRPDPGVIDDDDDGALLGERKGISMGRIGVNLPFKVVEFNAAGVDRFDVEA